MKKKAIQVIELIPDDGNWLTQAELQQGEERIFSDSVFCGIDAVDYWQEVTNEWKEQWEAEHAPAADDTDTTDTEPTEDNESEGTL